MTPRTKKRPSLFPAYTPPSKENPTMEEWAQNLGEYMQVVGKRVIAFGSLLAMVASGGAYVTHTNEVQPVNDATARVKAVEDSVNAHSRRISEVERLMRTNIYISCQVLVRVQPAQSIQPQECR